MSGHILPSHGFVRGAAPATRRVPSGRGAGKGWLATVLRMARAIEERRTLATLDDRMLADIGINRLEAEREVGRAPWDVRQRG